jgi:hypothetical protein
MLRPVTPVAEGRKRFAKPRRLTDINANHEPPRWSPDGKFIYTARQVDIAEDEPFSNSGIFRIRVEDGESELPSMIPIPASPRFHRQMVSGLPLRALHAWKTGHWI